MADTGGDASATDGRSIGASDRTSTLRSLAPEYIDDEHGDYVRHLNEAINDPKIQNIALTGRYGSGKSSILDEFLRQNTAESSGDRPQLKVIRIAINTIGPDPKEDLTNRIQKELVKQLIYRAKPGEIRSTRFARHATPQRWTVVWQGGIVGLVLLGVFRLVGIWPNQHALPGWAVLPSILFNASHWP